MKDQFIAALKLRPFRLDDCSLCGYALHFRIVGEQLQYDNGCNCTNTVPNWNNREIDELDLYINDPVYEEQIRSYLDEDVIYH